MEDTIKVLNELRNINGAYDLSVERIDEILAEIPEAKICTPIIGKFSSGKSALVNTLLGYSRRILKEDITPETAVPAEILYNENESVRLYHKDGEHEDIEVDEYRGIELDAMQITRVKLGLKNSFLEEIPDVMIVDMPGFESGSEVHNKAIDDYLPQSLAYIVAFPADDLIIRSSVGNILKELVLNEMPICIAITKYDKRNDEFDASLEKFKESLRRFIGEREVKICQTSKFNGDADEIKEFLVQIQEQSQEILSRKFKGDVLSAMENTESYLKTTLKNNEMSESELDEEEERLGKQLNGLEDKFAEEKEDFDLQISEAIEEIKEDVEAALEAEESKFVAMAMNGQNISDQINSVVRNAVTASVNKRFVPKVEKYLKRVKKRINSEEMGNIRISFHLDVEKINAKMTASIVAVVAGLVLGLPVIGVIVAYFLNKSAVKKKREEQKNAIRAKLRNEVYPQIMKEVANGVETTITKQIELVNTSIEDEIDQQRNTLEKAMSDLRTRMSEEKATKENLAVDIQNDLDKIQDLREMITG